VFDGPDVTALGSFGDACPDHLARERGWRLARAPRELQELLMDRVREDDLQAMAHRERSGERSGEAMRWMLRAMPGSRLRLGATGI
jgi:hypothetical protein